MRTPSLVGHGLVLALAATAVVTAGPSRTAVADEAPVSGAVYVPVEPRRVADTRAGTCTCEQLTGSTIRADVVPDDALATDGEVIAAAVTVTVTRTTADGFVTVHASGSELPDASMLNFVAGRDAANSTIVPVGDGGRIDVVPSAPTDVIVDVTGVFVAADAARAGRFVPLAPSRLVDTRGIGSLGPAERLVVPIPSAVADDATALAVNVTSVDAPAPGFVSISPDDGSAPTTSFLNLDGTGAARAASTIAPLDERGRLVIESSVGGHLIVDAIGWFTGPSAAESEQGRFVPLPPTRVLDSRADGVRLWPGGTRELTTPVSGAAALVSNVTMVRTDGPGFVTAVPAGTPLVDVSAINADGRDTTIANATITRVSDRGVAYFSDAGTDLIVDVTGSFTGDPVTAVAPRLPNDRPLSRVMLVGDSTMAGIRWYGDSRTALRGMSAIVDVESCRRLLRPSCRGREGRAPSTAVQAIRAAPGWLDTVVVQTGYNDWNSDFTGEFAATVGAARSKGARQIVWLTYADAVGSSPSARAAYARNNVLLAAAMATGAYPDVVIADWQSYTRGVPSWFIDDGVHFTVEGAYGAADYVARWVAHLEGRPCPVPWAQGESVADPCPDPDATRAQRGGVPDVVGLHDVDTGAVHCYEDGPSRVIVCEPDREA